MTDHRKSSQEVSQDKETQPLVTDPHHSSSRSAAQTNTAVASRRRLLAGGIPAALGLLAACGKAVVSDKKKPTGDDDGSRVTGNGTGNVNGAQGTQNPAGNGSGDGSGNNNNNGGATAQPTSQPSPTGTPNTGGNTNNTGGGDMTATGGMCMPFDLGEVDFSSFTSDTTLVSGKALYGSRQRSALLALKVPSAQAGGFIHVVAKESATATKGRILASRRFNSNDLGKPILFDGLKLGSVQFLEILVSQGGSKKRASLGSADADFVTSYEAKPVVDAYGIVANSVAAFATSMPVMAFGELNAGTGFDSVEFQRHTNTLSENRPMKVAQDGSTWASNPTELTAAGVIVTDALGGRITTVGSNFLALHHVFIAYVPVGDKYHRYFYFVG